eukprot:4143578-Amphidinium_carterae.1
MACVAKGAAAHRLPQKCIASILERRQCFQSICSTGLAAGRHTRNEGGIVCLVLCGRVAVAPLLQLLQCI